MSETFPTDVRLLALIAERDPQALELLYERYAKTGVFIGARYVEGPR